MKIILYDDNEVTILDLKQALEKKNNEVTIFRKKIKDHKTDVEFEHELKNAILHIESDLVFSVFYYPVISNTCNHLDIPYISWVFDSPSLPTYSVTINNPCNHVFLFDRTNFEELKNYGVNTIYHLPLASNVERLYHTKMSRRDWKDYSCDVSMMVNLYDQNFYDQINYLPPYLKGYLEGIMNAQLNVYGYNLLEDSLPPIIIEEFKKYVKYNMGEDYFINDPQMIADIFLTDKLASLERHKIISELSKQFRLTLYTGSDVSGFSNINAKGYIDYNTNMPKAFKGSKINVNTSVRSIKSGIPLRVLDIMASGGFVISNYQQEIVEHFVPDKEIVIYASIEELIEKIQYYLIHEDERKEIANNGYGKVNKYHSYDVKLDTIFHTVFRNT